MSFTTCPHCGGHYHWAWEEAFDKFGFNDGDGIVMTDAVADALRSLDLSVSVTCGGLHSTVIAHIERNGSSVIPDTVSIGYDDPRDYLPDDIVHYLDRRFPEGREVRS